jgi:hypothetical protein
VSSPLSFSRERLVDDLFVLVSATGFVDFTLRDLLNLLATRHLWIVVALWITCGLLFTLLVVKKARGKILVGLVWFIIGLSPLRTFSANFFTLSNLYLCVPVVAIGTACFLIWMSQQARFLALTIGICLTVFWAYNLVAAQGNLATMGAFGRDLHATLQQYSKDRPGPLRVIINVPDPFRTAQDYNMAHFMVFRVVQSAMQLGGYSEQNISFVEGKAVQVLSVDHGAPCEYEATVLDNERILIGSRETTGKNSKCFSKLRFIDFVPQLRKDGTSLVAHRRQQFSGVPLTEAQVYIFDDRSLHLRVQDNY